MHIKYFYWVGIILLVYSHAAAKDMPAIFDSPVKQEIIPLPNNSKISCFYYPKFMVKEVDMGEKGAEKLSITLLKPTTSLPCKKDNAEEIPIKDWAGYFAGVKGEYVFFDSDDGYNGGMPFAVFSGKDGKKLFEDSSAGGAKNFHKLTLSDHGLTIDYRRVYHASCSLYANEAECWKIIKREANISKDSPAPDCIKKYKDEQKRTPQYATEIAKSPSMIGYEVEAVYTLGKFSFTGLPGKTTCWLPD